MRIRLLALDLAGHTGYAIQTRKTRKVGTVNLVRGKLGPRSPVPMVRLYRRLDRLPPVNHVVFEETFARGAAKYRLDSLQHAVILWAVNRGIKWTRVSPTAWKKTMLGDGKATKHDYSVAAVEAFPDVRLWTDDQCAALWLLEYGLRQRRM